MKNTYIILFIITFAICATSTFCPFNFRVPHTDASVYVPISQGIIRGLLPYADYFDNKGPFFYLMNVPGIMLGGFTGIWITEIILNFISVLFAYKTALFFGNKRSALLGTVCAFIICIYFFTVPAGVEEYALPFFMISIYIFTKYYFAKGHDIHFLELIILGLCFAAAFFIRINTFPLWAGFCLIIFVQAIAKRQFLLLGKYITGFLLGAIIIAFPIYLYLRLNNIFDDFIQCVIFSGSARVFSNNDIIRIGLNYFETLDRGAYSIVPFIFGVYFILKKYKENNSAYYIGYTLSYILTLLFISFSAGHHYSEVITPFLIPPFTMLAGVVCDSFSNYKHKRVIIALFLCIIFSEGLAKFGVNILQIFTNKTGKELLYLGNLIDENTSAQDTIISLYNNTDIYPFTKRNPASKFFYQSSGARYYPEMFELFEHDIFTNKPKIIVIAAKGGTYNYLGTEYKNIYNMISDEYNLLSDKYGYFLFKRNNIGDR